MQNTQEKANLQETKVNDTKQERSMWMEISFIEGKNGSHMPNSFKLLWSGRHMKPKLFMEFLKFTNIISKACLSYLNVFMMLKASFQYIYGQH